MGFFLRSSIGIMQYTKRMFCKGIAQNTLGHVKVTRKIFHIPDVVESDLLLNKKLKNNEAFDGAQWAAVREELINLNNGSEITVDSQIYDLCLHYEKLDEALSYFRFLESNNYKLNLNTISTCLKVYFLRKTQITPEEEKEICRIYDQLRKEYSLLDGQTCNCCILALSLTKRWKESLELIEMVKLADNPGITVMGAVICAALRNDEFILAWELMNECIAKKPLVPSVYLEYLDYCKRHFSGDELKEEIEKMLMFWREHQVEPTEYVVKVYASFFDSIGYNTSYTSISKGGRCYSCNKKLQETALSLEDFKMLSGEILKKVIIGENVFCATSPQELKRYMVFIRAMKPYDVVIDGLNVAYASRKKGEPGSLQAILQVAEYFLNRGSKRILVVGRVHMNWWSSDIMKKIKEKAEVFLIKNISQDDPFLLHITLLSGPQTYFVSRDLMRQHKYKLIDQSVQKIFKQWQLSRQFKHTKSNTGKIQLIPPLPFEVTAQQNENGWHIPYTKHTALQLPQIYDQPQNWVCVKKTKLV